MIRKSDWKTKPVPENKVGLGFEKNFSEVEIKSLLEGFKPKDMDDRWFVYSEEDWVYFVRSWSGIHIFGFKLKQVASGGMKVVESWVNENPDEFRSPGKQENIRLINGILKILFKIEF